MRVLIAEDDPISRKLLESTLKKWDYEVQVTCDGQEAWEKLQEADAPRLVVLDWMMPRMDGPEVCKKLRAMPGGEFFYILLLTAKGTKDNIIDGLDAGADDYVVKPFNSRELRVRMSCGRRIVKLQSELVKTQDQLRIQATHDSMTGIFNRAAIYEAMEREQARSIRENVPLTVIMVDLDHFKSINDNFGHASGDIVLKEAARRMRENSRKYDMIGRYGGEEFILVLPHCDHEAGRNQAERLRQCLAGEQVDIGTRKIPISASLGVAATDQFAVDNVDELVRLADRALYVAKDSGRNKVILAGDELIETAMQEME